MHGRVSLRFVGPNPRQLALQVHSARGEDFADESFLYYRLIAIVQTEVADKKKNERQTQTGLHDLTWTWVMDCPQSVHLTVSPKRELRGF